MILLRLMRIYTPTLATTEPEEKECLWKINPIITSIDKLNFNATDNVKGEWFINENLDLAYFFKFASDSVPQTLVLI